MAKFSEALGRWVCPVEFRRKFLDPKIGGGGGAGSGEAADDDEIDGGHDEVMKGCTASPRLKGKGSTAAFYNFMFKNTTSFLTLHYRDRLKGGPRLRELAPCS